MKLDDYGFKQYNIGETTARILRDSLLECEEGINSLGRSVFNYPEDQITGKQNYYNLVVDLDCLLYTSPSPRDRQKSRMPSSA